MLASKIDRCFPQTAPGTAALATVRFAGERVAEFVAARFSKPLKPGRPTHGELRDDRGVIDDPVVHSRADGRAADFTFHGGTSIVRAVRALAEASGFVWTIADGHPWNDPSMIGSVDADTMREHELLIALPAARTERAARTLLAQAAAWDRLQAHEVEPEQIAAMFEDRSLEHLLAPPTIAIVGLPNAGKSTLANALFGTRRSIVSPIAGTTRDWVGELADLDGLIVTLIDTPGLRETTDVIESQAIAQSAPTIDRADLVVLLLDATRDDAAQAELISRFPAALRCLNKIDVAHPAWTAARIDASAAMPLSAVTGEGVAELVARCHAAFGIGARPSEAPRAWTHRQRETLEAVLRAL